MVTFDEEKQNKRVEEMRKIEEEDVSKILAKRYGLEYLDLQSMPINSDALRVISEENARLGNIAAFDIVAKKIKIAVLSPKNEKTEAVIKLVEKDGYFPTLYMVSKASLEKAWSRYKDISFASESKAGSFDISNDHVVELTEKIKVVQDVIDMTAELNGIKQAYRISKIMEIMLAGSLALGASDIHIEPEETEVRMRFRLDGVLINIINFDLATYSLILSRIKLLSGLKLNVKSEAQDGRFAVKIKDSEIQIRTSVLPGAYSESIVMRLLNPKSISVPLESLGIEPRTLSILLEQIQKPNGMLLITGPTGSGKTTTLYAFMRKINSQDIKIITWLESSKHK
jgi:type II secretory ATPase GspE/PulE/Tfp pilus assembly ATPase PilB-like protein